MVTPPTRKSSPWSRSLRPTLRKLAARDRQVAMGKGVKDILGELSMWCMDNVGGDDWCVTERGWIDTGYTETGRVWWFQHQEDAVQFQLTWG